MIGVANYEFIICLVGAAFGLISLLMVWIFSAELIRGVQVIDYDTYKRYVNLAFIFFCAISIFLSVTNKDILPLTYSLSVSSVILWFITSLMIIVASIFCKKNDKRKKNMLYLLSSTFGKLMISAVIIWFIM